jgi:hypothetical protein
LPVSVPATPTACLEFFVPLRRKSFQQFVVQRQEKLCRTRIALTTGTAHQLPINSSGLVSLGSQHMQAA